MTNKVPVISTHVEGIPEALPNDEFGILIEPGHSISLAESITILADDSNKRDAIAKKVYQGQKDYFSTESMVQCVAVVYEEILSK